MLGLGTRLLLLALGGAAGYLIATRGAVPHLLPPPAAVEPPAPVLAAECPPAEIAAGAPRADPGRGLGQSLPMDDLGRGVEQSPPANPRTPAEWYAAYLAEPRDAAAAAEIEDRIEALVAGAGIPRLVADHVGCAGRRCAIAGRVDTASGFDSCRIGDWLGRAAVFRGDLRYTCIDQDEAGHRRFVVFVAAEPAP